MLDLGSLKYAPGAKQNKKRVGRGNGSGYGTTCGRGSKGYRARSGSKRRPWYEGGTMPLYRRVPKVGFTNIFRKEYQPINIKRINSISEDEITPEVLVENNIIKSEDVLYKILGEGEIEASKTVVAPAFSKSAKKKIEEAGGKAEIL
ncbi:MAG: 50S ribosomal protein L15 [Candidatus Marinimicrobia bacterium]|nr:50S ribosomal protein L15 [Candidatus Neomarinimicrobiota bacterium]